MIAMGAVQYSILPGASLFWYNYFSIAKASEVVRHDDSPFLRYALVIGYGSDIKEIFRVGENDSSPSIQHRDIHIILSPDKCK